MKMITADRDFQASNREKAKKWISELTPKVALSDKEKEPWVVAKLERRRDDAERSRIFRAVEPMPFQEWLEDVQEVERAVYGARLRHDEPPHGRHGHGEEASPDEHARLILQRMLSNENRGTINRHERDLAQQVALANLRRHWGKSTEQQKAFDALALEVRNGECTLAEQHGAVVRIVAFIVYSITFKGALLVELGTWKHDKVSGRICLPDSKQTNFERVEETIQRESNTFLLPFRTGMQMGEVEYSEYSQKSESSAITTVYHKSVQHATMNDGFDFPMLPLATYSNSYEVPQMCRQYSIFALRVRDKLRLYTWLRHEDYDIILHKAEGKASFAKWMDLMTINEAAALEALAWTTEGAQSKKPKVQISSSILDNFKSRFKTGKQDPSQDPGQDSSRRKSLAHTLQTSPNPENEVGCVANSPQDGACKGVTEKQAVAKAELEEYRHRRKTISTAARVLSKATTSEMRSSLTQDKQVLLAEHNKAAVVAVLAECRREALMEQGLGTDEEASSA